MDIASIAWDPSRVIFNLPFVHLPLTWYGMFFACGFLIGFQIFLYLFQRYLYFFPQFLSSDIEYGHLSKLPKTELCAKLRAKLLALGESKEAICIAANRLLEDMPFIQLLLSEEKAHPKRRERRLSFIGKVTSRNIEKRLEARLLFEKYFPGVFTPLKTRARVYGESLLIYVVLGTIIGARLGHLLFYEKWSFFMRDPLVIFRTWEGGLASHGGILGVVLGLLLFYIRKGRRYEKISFLRLLDLLSVPTMFVCSLIRVGNFFNQEILGATSTLPWAVTFGHPADGSFPEPRHPVQLYESLFYFFVFLSSFVLLRRNFYKWRGGKIAGYCFMVSFAFRFFIEPLKGELSDLLMGHDSLFLMGQYLSIPMVGIGVLLYFWGRITHNRQERLFDLERTPD